MRISAYAERLLLGLNDITGAKVLKSQSQRKLDWESVGASKFNVQILILKLRFSQQDPILFWCYFLTLAGTRIGFSNYHCGTEAEIDAYIEKRQKL
jgi:hypothetical protein